MQRGTVLSLFDYSGNMVMPWAKAGYRCICVDRKHRERDSNRIGTNIEAVGADIEDYLPPNTEYEIVFAFPPCTNLAVSGARWFQQKGLTGLAEAIELVEQARKIAEWANAPWMIENPVSTLSTYWREPDYTSHPYEYDGYTEEDNAYSKKTCLWTSDDFVMPETDAVEDYDNRIHKMPPSDDRAEKRSMTRRDLQTQYSKRTVEKRCHNVPKTRVGDTTKFLFENCGTTFWIVPSELEGCPGCGLLKDAETKFVQ